MSDLKKDRSPDCSVLLSVLERADNTDTYIIIIFFFFFFFFFCSVVPIYFILCQKQLHDISISPYRGSFCNKNSQ